MTEQKPDTSPNDEPEVDLSDLPDEVPDGDPEAEPKED